MAGSTKLTPLVHDQLIKAAAGGATNRDAAIMAGIHETTLWRWLTDPDPTDPLRNLQEAYETAKAGARFRSIRIIAESDDWKAHAWLLERVDPKHWGKAEIDLSGLEAKLAAYFQGRVDAERDRDRPVIEADTTDAGT